MKLKNPERRLLSLWGVIDRQHNALLAAGVKGRRVLDVGCGYGSLVRFLAAAGYDAVGIDSDAAAIERARSFGPGQQLFLASAEGSLPFADGSFDTIVLKDCLHHLAHEGEPSLAFRNFRRLLAGDGRIVVLDPNPTLLVRAARVVVRHRDPEESPAQAMRLLSDQGFRPEGLAFHEVIGLPLSGGYVGWRLVPNWAPLNRAVAALNLWFSAAVNRAGIGRVLCWRYVLHADVRRG